MAGKVKYGHFTAMGGLKLYPAIMKYLGIEGLIDVKRRTDLTVSYSPFGWVDEGGTAFVKGAPVAKHKTVAEIEALGDVGKAITGGLEKAIKISKAHKETGTAIVNIRGRLKRMPAKAAAMMKVGKKSALVKAVTVFA
jgi:hypothetical protein